VARQREREHRRDS
jgi:hypothetical protein